MHFVMFKILTFYNMLFPTTKIPDLLQNYSLYIFFSIQFADMFSIALTECINRISSSKFHKRQSTIFFCFCTCMWMQFTEMVIKCVLTVCGFPLELIHYSNPLIASLLELLQTNACATKDWGEAGHTCKSHPVLPDTHTL